PLSRIRGPGKGAGVRLRGGSPGDLQSLFHPEFPPLRRARARAARSYYNSPTLMIADFHHYEYELCRRFLIPLLLERGLGLDGKSVLDAGCGYGGVLAGLAERFRLAEALGIDLDRGMIANGREKSPPVVVLRTGDFLAFEGGEFDGVLLRDVLEHIVDVEGALAKAARLLKPGGFVFASFAPFLSPFGGHQHNGSGPFASEIGRAHV